MFFCEKKVLNSPRIKSINMKKTYIFSPIILGIGALLWISASGGVAKIQSKDRTGSPVSDVACTQCHMATGNFSTSAIIQLTDMSGGSVTAYVPGEVYNLKVRVQSSGNVGHGFQVTGLLSDNTSAGTCSSPSVNTAITPLNGRWYFEQTGAISNGEYEMVWTAPASGSGVVTFYGVALAHNGDGMTTGDEFVNIPNTVITEDISSGITEVAGLQVNLFPNPVQNVLSVQAENKILGINVIDISGKSVLKTVGTGSLMEVNVAELPIGTYFMEVTSTQGVEKATFIKN